MEITRQSLGVARSDQKGEAQVEGGRDGLPWTRGCRSSAENGTHKWGPRVAQSHRGLGKEMNRTPLELTQD